MLDCKCLWCWSTHEEQPTTPPSSNQGKHGQIYEPVFTPVHDDKMKRLSPEQSDDKLLGGNQQQDDEDDAKAMLQASNHFFPELVPYRLESNEVLLTRKLSSGAFGVVWLGFYHGKPVAIKKMLNGVEESRQFAREIMTMARLDHPRIVAFMGAIWTNAGDLGGVTEYMDGGDLRTVLEKDKIPMSWKQEKISIAIDIAEALKYMHSLTPRIIHRDLKSRNVLMTKKLVAKLSDFGLSRNRSYEETLTAGVGTVRWTAPEVMLGEDYSEQADIYSFGVMMSELDTREIPYENKSIKSETNQPDMALVTRILKGELRPLFNEDCPPNILHIAKACVQFDPNLRPTASKLVDLLNEAKIQLQVT